MQLISRKMVPVRTSYVAATLPTKRFQQQDTTNETLSLTSLLHWPPLLWISDSCFSEPLLPVVALLHLSPAQAAQWCPFLLKPLELCLEQPSPQPTSQWLPSQPMPFLLQPFLRQPSLQQPSLQQPFQLQPSLPQPCRQQPFPTRPFLLQLLPLQPLLPLRRPPCLQQLFLRRPSP